MIPTHHKLAVFSSHVQERDASYDRVMDWDLQVGAAFLFLIRPFTTVAKALAGTG